MLRCLVSAFLFPALAAASVGAQDDPAPAGGEVPIYQDTGQEPIFETEFVRVGDHPLSASGIIQTPDGRVLAARSYVEEYHEDTDSWEQLYNWAPSPADMLAFNPDTLFMVTGYVYRSLDGGHNWTSISPAGDFDLDLTPWNEVLTGGHWCSGRACGPMYISDDGGDSWRSGEWIAGSDLIWSATSVGTTPSGTFVVGTVPAGLGYSHDDGRTWHRSNLFEYGRFQGMSFAWVPNGPNGPRLLALVDDSTEPGNQLYASEDHGVTWERIGMFFDAPNGGAHHRNGFLGTRADYAFSDGSIYMVTKYARIWESRDGGETWQLFLRAPEILEEENCPTCSPKTFSHLLAQDGRFWFGVSRAGNQFAWVYRSVDPVPIAADNGPGSVEAPELESPLEGDTTFVEGEVSWSAVPEAATYRVQITMDSTYEEVVIDTTVSDTRWEFELEPGTYGWRAYAFDGTVRSPWSEVWPFEVIFPVAGEEDPDDQGALQLAVRPNPSSGLVAVELHLDTDVEVSLSIYDPRGRTIAVLEEGTLAAGNHTWRWNSSSAAPGTYVIRAETENATLSRSVTIVR